MEPINSVLYHRYLKGQSLFSDVNAASVISEEPLPTSSPTSPYNWDLPQTCKPMFPALDYISSRLSEEGLSIHLIISDQAPFVIPIWQLPYRSQVTLCKIIRKACQLFTLPPCWLTALGSLPKHDLPTIFDAFTPDSYIVRRSILQREIVYSSDGLTLLTIDHVFTLKQLLRTLSKKDWVANSRYNCLDSCVDLLNRIQGIYNGKPVSAAYIKRVYKETPIQGTALREVIDEYNARFCTPIAYQIDLSPSTTTTTTDPAPRTSSLLPPRKTQSYTPLEKELDFARTWAAIPLGPTPTPNPDYNNNTTKPSTTTTTITYPTIRKLSLPPPPPPPASRPPSRHLPPVPSTPTSTTRPSLQISVPTTTRPPRKRMSPSSASSSAGSSPFPLPLPLQRSNSNSKTSSTSPHSAASKKSISFPCPPGYPENSLPLLATSVFSDTESGLSVVAELTREEVAVLEGPMSFAEQMGWGVLCERCRVEVVGGGRF